jgi:lysophospholipid acyltransferase
LWLKYNIYIRLINVENPVFKGKESSASLISFILSAIWHGFYPMYYVFFFQFWLLEQSCTMLEKKLRFYEKIEKANVVVQQLVLLITMNLMNVLGLQFGLLLYSSNYLFCRNLYFIPNIFLAGMYCFLAFGVKGKRNPKPADTIKQEETKKTE